MELYELKNLFVSQYMLSSNHTIRKYTKDIDFMFNACDVNSVEELNNFNEINLKNFYDYCTEQELNVTTINQRLQVFKTFIKWCNNNKYIDNHYIESVKRIRTTNEVHYTPTKDEINTILDYVKNHSRKQRLYIMLNLIINTGLRRSEICNLKIEDIDFQNSTIKVIGKGKKIIIQPVHKDIICMIKNYIDTERFENMRKYVSMGGKDLGFVFVSGIGENEIHHNKDLQNGNQVNDCCLFIQIKNMAKASGIKNADKITPHSLRRFAGTTIYELTGDIKTASEFLRHSNISTTEQCYIDYNKERLVNATNELFSVVREEKPDNDYLEYLRLKKKFEN